MKLLLASVAAAALMVGPAKAQEPGPVVEIRAPGTAAAVPSGFQVARLGDSRMSCEALIGEINAINAELADNQNAMTARAMDVSRESMRGVRGASMASTALTVGGGVVAALIPGAGLALGAVQGVADMANEAAVAALQARQERQMDEMMTEMTAGGEAMMPLMSRIDHLTDISINKGC